MSNPATSTSDIDWDKMAKRLGNAFDSAMRIVEKNERHNDGQSVDKDFREALELANATAVVLAQVATQARAQRDATEKDNFKISKP